MCGPCRCGAGEGALTAFRKSCKIRYGWRVLQMSFQGPVGGQGGLWLCTHHEACWDRGKALAWRCGLHHRRV